MLGADINLAIAGNKMDLEDQRRVDSQTAEDYAKSVGARHFVTSAKMNQGIEELFLDLTQQMMAAADKKQKSGNNPSSRNGVEIVDDSPLDSGRKRSKCCGGGNGNTSGVVDGIPVDNNLAASSQ